MCGKVSERCRQFKPPSSIPLAFKLACYIHRILQYSQLHLPCGFTGQTSLCTHLQWASISTAATDKLGQNIDRDSRQDGFAQLVDCLIGKLRQRRLRTGCTAVTLLPVPN